MLLCAMRGGKLELQCDAVHGLGLTGNPTAQC